MDDLLHGSLIEGVSLNGAHFYKCPLRVCIIIGNKFRTGNRQLAWTVLQNISKRRNQCCQLDGLADLILRHAEEICDDLAGVVPLVILAKGLAVAISI